MGEGELEVRTSREITDYFHNAVKIALVLLHTKTPEETRKKLEKLENKEWISMESLKQWLQSSELLEKLAELEHEQWMFWAKNILYEEKLSQKRKDRWFILFSPYNNLPEEHKKSDRKWAQKIINELLGLLEKGGEQK